MNKSVLSQRAKFLLITALAAYFIFGLSTMIFGY